MALDGSNDFAWIVFSCLNCVDTISVLSLGGISNMYAQGYDYVLTCLQFVPNKRIRLLNALIKVSVVPKTTP